MKVTTTHTYHVDLNEEEHRNLILALSNVLSTVQDNDFLKEHGYTHTLLRFKTDLQAAPK